VIARTEVCYRQVLTCNALASRPVDGSWRDDRQSSRYFRRPITFAVLRFESGPALKILRQYGDADQKHPQRKDDEAPANIIATQQKQTGSLGSAGTEVQSSQNAATASTENKMPAMAAALGVLKFVRVSSASCVMVGFLPCYIEPFPL